MSLTNLAATMSRSIDASRTAPSASRAARSVISELTNSPIHQLANSLDPLRRHLADQRQLELSSLIRLVHQEQPRRRRRGNHDEDHDERAEQRDDLQQDIDRENPDEHERRLHRVKAHELVILLDEQKDDAGDEVDEVAQSGREFGFQ